MRPDGAHRHGDAVPGEQPRDQRGRHERGGPGLRRKRGCCRRPAGRAADTGGGRRSIVGMAGSCWAGPRHGNRFTMRRRGLSARSRGSPMWPNFPSPYRCLGHLMKIGTTHPSSARSSMPDPTTTTPRPTEPVAFPQDRTCPYHPPTGYDPLRTDRPLSRVTLYDGRPVWLVTGHALARDLLADPRLSSDRTRDGFPATTPRFAAVRNRRTALLGVDDPEHRTQRRMMVPSFTLKRAAALRPRIQGIVDELLDAMIAQGPPAELVGAFALPVPSMVICELLGVPYADHEFFEEQSRRLLRGPDVADTLDARERAGGVPGRPHRPQAEGTGGGRAGRPCPAADGRGRGGPRRGG
ncbi:cytochrome P450-SOY, partial [Streptomyces sp. e14]